MPLRDAVEHYRNKLERETRQRIKSYFSGVVSISEKERSYLELLDYLPSYEHRYLLLSLYFDPNLFEILPSIYSQFARKCSSIIKELHMHSMFTDRGISLQSRKTFFSELFKTKFGISTSNFENETVTRNDSLNAFLMYLTTNFDDPSADENVSLALLHYSKVWQVYYSFPYNHSKGILLLSGLSKSLMTAGRALRLNFPHLLVQLRSVLDELPHKIILPPYLEESRHAEMRHCNSPGYLRRLEEFQIALQALSAHFNKYDNLNYKDIFEKYYNSNKLIQADIVGEITRRVSAGDLPSSEDMAHMLELAQESEMQDNFRLSETLQRQCYLFELT